MVIAEDIGYSYTKNNFGRMFKSAMTTDDNAVSGAYKMNIDDKTYYVGCGKGSTSVEKFDSELSKVLLLTDLYLTGGNEYYVITGLPIAQYKSQKDNYKQSIMKYSKSIVNEKTIRILDVTIFPQCAGSLYSQNIQESCIIIDIGGRTTDFGVFLNEGGKFTQIKYNTLYCGMESLYSDVIKSCNEHFNLSLENWQAEDIVRKGLMIDGEKQDLKFLQSVFISYADTICKELELNYPIHNLQVYLTGGGASSFLNPLKAIMPSIKILNDSQFSNALGFYNVGRQMYG